MRRAIELAASGLGRVWPNPSVGAVVVNHGRIVGAARTQTRGRPHAEVVALRQAGAEARGGTMYVSLEPCSHWGRTPPCCDAIIGAGIARVVVAVLDPDPRVNGRGLQKLEAAGLQVELGLHADEAAEVNAGFFCRVRLGRPLTRAVSGPPRDEVPDTFDATLRLDDGRWSALVAHGRDPLDLRPWFFTRDDDEAVIVTLAPDRRPGSDRQAPEADELPPAAVLATLGREGLTRVAVPAENPAVGRLRANDLLD